MALHRLPSFSPEIIDHIIDSFCQWNDKSALFSCALVSPTFRYSSQKNLFKEISLGTSLRGQTSLLKLSGLLSRNPYLSLHIRKLHLSCDPERSDDGYGGFPLVGMLHSIVEKLVNLRSLYLAGYGRESDSWACFTADTQMALFKLARCAPITTIEFEEVNRWPIGFLRHCAHLKHLKIRAFCDPFVSDATLDKSTELSHARVQFKLESLQLKTSPSPTLFTLIGTSHPALRTLAFTSNTTRDTAGFAAMVRSCTGPLERLIVIHTHETDTCTAFSTDTFDGLTNLRRISVKGHNIETCKSLIALLKDTAGVRPIEDISIRFYGIENFSPISDAAIWEELNCCFTKHLMFPHLRTVYVGFESRLPTWGAQIMEEDAELLEGFYRTLSCIQANPHIFHLNGNNPIFFKRLEEEARRRS